jgi:hypothetical protein
MIHWSIQNPFFESPVPGPAFLHRHMQQVTVAQTRHIGYPRRFDLFTATLTFLPNSLVS